MQRDLVTWHASDELRVSLRSFIQWELMVCVCHPYYHLRDFSNSDRNGTSYSLGSCFIVLTYLSSGAWGRAFQKRILALYSSHSISLPILCPLCHLLAENAVVRFPGSRRQSRRQVNAKRSGSGLREPALINGRDSPSAGTPKSHPRLPQRGSSFVQLGRTVHHASWPNPTGLWNR